MIKSSEDIGREGRVYVFTQTPDVMSTILEFIRLAEERSS